MLNPSVKAADYAEQFQREGFVEVENFLTEQVAHRFYQILDAELQWQLAFLNAGVVRQIPQSQLIQMDERELEELERKVAAQAARGFQFRFMRATLCDSHTRNELESDSNSEPNRQAPHEPISEAGTEASGLELSQALRGAIELAQLMIPELIEFCRSVTGDMEIRHANMYGSYYPPGSYLKSHDDSTASKRRRAAYVLSLTKEWVFDWGGLLVFEDKEKGRIERALAPRFNKLILFTVPKAHHVTLVRDYARGKRYALQGWLSS